MAVDNSCLLPETVTKRRDLTTLSDQEWDLLLPAARAAGMLPRLAVLAGDAGILANLPSKVQDHLAAARALGESNERLLRWELDRARCVLAPLDVPVLLLKGAAYMSADLPLARGRLATDVDIMVPRQDLGVVEDALLGAGWFYENDDRLRSALLQDVDARAATAPPQGPTQRPRRASHHPASDLATSAGSGKALGGLSGTFDVTLHGSWLRRIWCCTAPRTCSKMEIST